VTTQVIEPVYLEKFEDLKNELEKNNVILLGAPTVGKTENLIKHLIDNPNVLFICELGNKIEKAHKRQLGGRLILPGNLKQRLEEEDELLSKYSFIIIDDFYKVFQEYTKENNSDSILEILKKKKGVCIVSTPYRMEWLIERSKEERLARLEDFTKKSRCKFLAIEDEELAKNVLKEYIAKEENVNKILVNCKWIYDFKNVLLREKFSDVSYGPKKYRRYETFTPYAFIQFKNLDDKLGFFDETLLNMVEHSSFTAIHDYLHHIFEGVVEDMKPFLSGLAIPLALIYFIFQIHKNDNSIYDNIKNSFGNLQYLTYPELENLEKKAGLQPLTLVANKQVLSIKQNEWEKIEDLLTHHKELVELVEKHNNWDDCVLGLEQLEKINYTITELLIVGDIINKTIFNSVEEDLDIEYDPQIELKKRGIISEDLNIKTVCRDELTDQIITEIENGRRLIVLKGPGGIGKTTLSINIAKKLRKDNYFVGVPIPEHISFLEYRLNGIRGISKGIVLFSEYKIAPTRIDDIILPALKLLNSGAYNCLVIVCRDEVYEAFEEAVQTGAFGGISSSIEHIFKEGKPPIEVPPLKKDEVEEIINQIWQENKIQKEIEPIMEISGGNPLFAILSADWILNGNSIDGITKQNFLKKYVIEKVYQYAPPELQNAYLSIACARRIDKEHLKYILGLERKLAEWGNIEKNLQRCLEGTSYTLTPDVFSEIIFQEKCLPKLNDYISLFRAYPQYLFGISENLAIAYKAGEGWARTQPIESKTFMNFVEEQANTFIAKVSELDTPLYIICFQNILISCLPIAPETVKVEKMVAFDEAIASFWGAIVERKYLDKVTIEMAISNILTKLILNHVVEKKTTNILDAVDLLAISFIEKLNQKKGVKINTGWFMQNFYSMSILKVALHYKPKEKKDWIDEIEKRAAYSVEKFNIQNKSLSEFMVNVYSIFIFSIAEKFKPHEKMDWIDEIEERAALSVEKFKIPNQNVEFFMLTIYSMSISKIADHFGSQEGKDWIDEIEKRVATANNRLDALNHFDLLVNFYSMSLSMIADKSKPHEKKDWIDEIEERAAYAVEKFNILDITSKNFLQNFYSQSILFVVEKWKPHEKEDWIEEIEKRIAEAPEQIFRKKFGIIVNPRKYTAFCKILLIQNFNHFFNKLLKNNDEKNLYNIYLWDVFFLKRNIIPDSVLLNFLVGVRQFILNSSLLIMSFSNRISEDSTILFKNVDELNENIKDDIFSELLTDQSETIQKCIESIEEIDQELFKRVVCRAYSNIAGIESIADGWEKRFIGTLKDCK